MDRNQVRANLAVDFGPLATAAGTQNPGALWQNAITNAYGAMGIDLSAIATAVLSTQQAADLPWLAEYFVLRSLVRQLAVKVDSVTGKQQRKSSEIATRATALLADATAAVQSRGYALDTTFGLGRLDLDYLEPFYGVPTGSSIVG